MVMAEVEAIQQDDQLRATRIWEDARARGVDGDSRGQEAANDMRR